jgi:PEGA domain
LLTRLWFHSFVLVLLFCAAIAPASLPAQNNKVMGELKFEGVGKLERDAGVWVDGNYVGYVKELKGKKKILLIPGKHQIIARQAGYSDFVRDIVVEPGQIVLITVQLSLLPNAQVPKVTSMLKLTIHPPRAAVFLDGNYVGHAGELGGSVHALLVSPGKHHIKVELPGYRTFETEVDLIAGQKSEVKTNLVEGSIEQASPDIKKP